MIRSHGGFIVIVGKPYAGKTVSLYWINPNWPMEIYQLYTLKYSIIVTKTVE